MKPLLAIVVLLVVLCGGASAAEPATNLWFIISDDLRARVLCVTPNIDSLASQGARFQNGFVSQSICWVSRTTILTGLTSGVVPVRHSREC